MATKGKVVTVHGLVEPSSLGLTLTHEHFSLDFAVAFTPPAPHQAGLVDCPLTMHNLGWIRQNPYSHRPNISFNGPEVDLAVQEDVAAFREAGGGCIVENTTHGIKRNLPLMAKIARETGVKVVAGAGFYVDASQDVSVRTGSKLEDMVTSIEREMTEGVEGIKCGIVGEVGCSYPLTDFERLSIAAAGKVQASLGCPVMFHPGRDPSAPREILRLYQEAGGDVTKAVMGHLDRTIFSRSSLLEFAEMGSFLEYDLFGIEASHYQLHEAVDMPSDAQRIEKIKMLTEEGYGDRILLSHDIHTRHRLTAFGGHGFSHLLVNVLPKMRTRGLTEEQIRCFMETNPQSWLAWTK